MSFANLFSKAAALVGGILSLNFASTAITAGESQNPEVSFMIRKLMETNVEGPDVERSYFMAAGKRLVFGTPKGCRLTNSDGGLDIILTDAGLDGEIHISRSSFTPESDLARDVLKYRDAASKDIPKGTTRIEVQQPTMNPYPYNGWKSLGFTWTYAFYGRPLVRTVSYINLEVGAQVVITTVAGEKDASKVAEIARQFMSSWWVMAR